MFVWFVVLVASISTGKRDGRTGAEWGGEKKKRREKGGNREKLVRDWGESRGSRWIALVVIRHCVEVSNWSSAATAIDWQQTRRRRDRQTHGASTHGGRDKMKMWNESGRPAKPTPHTHTQQTHGGQQQHKWWKRPFSEHTTPPRLYFYGHQPADYAKKHSILDSISRLIQSPSSWFSFFPPLYPFFLFSFLFSYDWFQQNLGDTFIHHPNARFFLLSPSPALSTSPSSSFWFLAQFSKDRTDFFFVCQPEKRFPCITIDSEV